MNYDYTLGLGNPPNIKLNVTNSQIPLNVEAGKSVALPPYEGPYEVTPSGEEQTLATANKTTVENIVIKPIPSNYGLISWNGSVLTVS